MAFAITPFHIGCIPTAMFGNVILSILIINIFSVNAVQIGLGKKCMMRAGRGGSSSTASDACMYHAGPVNTIDESAQMRTLRLKIQGLSAVAKLELFNMGVRSGYLTKSSKVRALKKYVSLKFPGSWETFKGISDNDKLVCIQNAKIKDSEPETPSSSGAAQSAQTQPASSDPDPPTKGLPDLHERQQMIEVIAEINSKVARAGITGSIGLSEAPRLVLMGQQSVGKSRILETLAGQPFTYVVEGLGTTRPTEVEFRSVPEGTPERWSRYDTRTDSWLDVSEKVLLQWLTTMNNDYDGGERQISRDKLRIRFESPHTCDMTIVDLPGERKNSGAPGSEEERIKLQIDSVIHEYIEDENSIMLCVEEAGEGVGMGFYPKCRAADAEEKRTWVIRNKFDKLRKTNPGVVTANPEEWLRSDGRWVALDTPMYTVSCPNWQNDTETKMKFMSPHAFREMKKSLSDQDETATRNILSERGTAATLKNQLIKKVGFYNFERQLTVEMTNRLAASVPNIEHGLKAREEDLLRSMEKLEASQKYFSSPEQLEEMVKDASLLFGDVVAYILQNGFEDPQLDQYLPKSTKGIKFEPRPHLARELQIFNEQFDKNKKEMEKREGDYAKKYLPSATLPCKLFDDLDSYIKDLEHYSDGAYPLIENFGKQSTGSMMMERLLDEVEHFMKYAEVDGMLTLDKIVSLKDPDDPVHVHVRKVLKKIGKDSLMNGIRYAGQRMLWFFDRLKEMAFALLSMPGLAEQTQKFGAKATRFEKAQKLLSAGQQVKDLLSKKWDKVVETQMEKFIDFAETNLDHVFREPWSLPQMFTDRGLHKHVVQNVEAAKLVPTNKPELLLNKAKTVQRVDGYAKLKRDVGADVGVWKSQPDCGNAGDADKTNLGVYGLTLELFNFVRADAVAQLRRHAKTMFLIPLTDGLSDCVDYVQIKRTPEETRAMEKAIERFKTEKKAVKRKIAAIEECQRDLANAKASNMLMQRGRILGY